jgi:hypothetical protein
MMLDSLSRTRARSISFFLYAVRAYPPLPPSVSPYLPPSIHPSILPCNPPTVPLPPPPHRARGCAQQLRKSLLAHRPTLATWHPHAHIERESDRHRERRETARERGRIRGFFDNQGALKPSPERRSAQGAGTHTLTRAENIHVPTSMCQHPTHVVLGYMPSLPDACYPALTLSLVYIEPLIEGANTAHVQSPSNAVCRRRRMV